MQLAPCCRDVLAFSRASGRHQLAQICLRACGSETRSGLVRSVFFGYRLIDGFEYEDGNQSACFLRVTREWLEGVHGTIPPDRSFVTDEFAS
jgi:hypothetical protein